MKTRLLLLITLSSLMALTFACGGAPATNNTNANKPANTASNTAANTAANTASNTVANTASNTAANKPANTAANAAKDDKSANKAAKPPKGSTAECNDGTFSDSKTPQGQCSGHGGVKRKLP